MMKAKKLLSRLVIAVLSFCMIFGTLSLAACGDSGNNGGDVGGDADAVKITLSQTTATIQVNKQVRLTGTINVDGAKLTWSSEDETIATVTETGAVKGVKPGKTNIKASYESYSATCEVTVIDAVTVTLNKTELALNVGEEETLTAEASNGGDIEWSVSDGTVISVAGGKVTALKEGTATVYAESAGSRAECAVTVTDPTRTAITSKTFDDIKETDYDKMFYFAVDGATAKADDLYYSKADDTYHVKFENSGWAWYGFQLFFIKSGISGADNNVSFTLNSSAAGHITVNGTTVVLVAGDNKISLDNCTGSLSIQFGENNGKTENDITGTVTVVISDLEFTHYTPEKLAAPTAFSVDNEAKTIAITDDANGDKAQSYRVVFYKGEDKVAEVPVSKNGTINDGAIADGEYTLTVYAYSTGKYISSDEYVPDPAISYTVANGGIKYDVTFAGEAAIDEGKWYYWNEAGTVKANVEGNSLIVDFNGNTGNWYNMQFFYLDPVVDSSKDNKIVFTLNSNKAGNIQINGNIIEIKAENVGKDVEYTIYNIGTGKATVSIQMGASAGGINISEAKMTFTFGSPVAVEYQKIKLATPSIAFGDEYAYTITDSENDVANVTGYNLVFYKDDKAITTVKTTTKTGTIDISAIASGTYTVKAVATGSGLYANSDESEGVSLTVVNEAGIKYDIQNGDEAAACSPENSDKWIYWNDQNWVGSNVTMVGKPTFDNGTVTIGYTSTGTCAFGLQLFYKDSSFSAGTSHKLTIKVTAEKDATITVNGKSVVLKAGVESMIEVTTDEVADKASISIQIDISAATNANTFTFSGIVLEEVAEEQPEE